MRGFDPGEATSAPAALAVRARLRPHDPWLFYRDGWDWRWRSFAQVADQVARGATEARRRFPEPGTRIAFDASQDPDAVAAGLAIQAAGGVAVAVDGDGEAAAERACAAWAEAGERASSSEVAGAAAGAAAGERVERLALPAARSPVDRAPLEPLELDPGSPGALEASDAAPFAPGELIAAARRLDALLRPTGKQVIACAAPGLELRASQRVQAWTLVRGAAWVLEPLAEAFIETVLWARPTVVFGRAEDLQALTERMQVRKHRRHSRLEVLGVAGGGTVGPEPWNALGVRISAIDEHRSPATDPD